ncbi:hypothetical protein BC830DRAFT_1175388 [Chytriomyces sp. MP71]|nr:hypothetical protein BC830DRAFT_1175388 [Chytriomyces sp. MP71]
MLVLGLQVAGQLNASNGPLTSSEDMLLLEWLNPSVSAVDDHRGRLLGQYVPGTREWLKTEVEEWIGDVHDSAARVLWLNAPAGIGKSVMAALVADQLQRENLLGAAFFCKHDDLRLKLAQSLVTTVAYSLSKWCPFIGRFLLTLRTAENAVDFRANSSQLFKQLVVDPLNEIASIFPPKKPIVIIVDALDECGEMNSRGPMLRIFAAEFKKLPGFVRVLVTSRREPDIVDAFTASNLPQRIILPSDSDNERDATIVAETRLKEMGVIDASLRSSISRRLLNKSKGLFVWLTMALGSLKGHEITLERVDNLPQGLDEIYASVFAKFFGRRTDPILTLHMQLKFPWNN